MYKRKKIAVSVPAYNENKLIKKTLETIPSFIDFIIVVDDKSKDNTVNEIIKYKKKDKRIHLITSKINRGLGATVIDAHMVALKKKADIVVVMAGDNQMDPAYLPELLNPIIDQKYDYVKGNRFFHRQDLKKMPRERIIGNIFLTFVSKFCTGYWSISDPINGYTALRMDTFKKIDVSKIASRYGFEPSLLIELAIINARVKDVFIPAKYGNEKSKVNLLLDPLKIIKTLLKGYIRRLFYKYTLYNFHPIALFYAVGYFLLLIGIILGIIIAWNSILIDGYISSPTITLFIVSLILGMQLILQAIVLDIQNEPK